MPPLGLPARASDGVVALRRLRDDDAEAYAAAFVADPELGRLLGVECDPDAAAVRERLSRLEEQAEAGRLVELAIADASSDAFRGAVVLHSFDWHSLRAEVGFWVVPEARRAGTVSRALALALDWLFDELGLERVEMTTTSDNDAVAALARKLGFVREGVLRQRDLERGRRVDVVWFGLLRSEWHGAQA